MKKYEITPQWLREHEELVKQGYGVALGQMLDIESLDDVRKLLEIVDPDSISEENIRTFSDILLLFEHQLNEGLKKLRRIKGKRILN